MSCRLITLLIVLSILSCFSFILWTRAQPTQEIAYDDGMPDTYANQDVGNHLAVKFSLPSGWSSAKLLTVRYHIHSDPTTFRLHVYDSDGVTEILHLDVTPATIGWFDVDLSSYDIILTGDFYVTIEYLTRGQPSIDADMTSPIDLRSYRGTLGSWTLFNDMDVMIRAVVQQPVQVGESLKALAVTVFIAVSLTTVLKKRR